VHGCIQVSSALTRENYPQNSSADMMCPSDLLIAIIFLDNTKWLVLVMTIVIVYYEVGTGSL
jgi:hypothetical protein